MKLSMYGPTNTPTVPPVIIDIRGVIIISIFVFDATSDANSFPTVAAT